MVSEPTRGDGFQTWQRLVQETLNPSAKSAADGPDPWDTLVDQLWQANPFSKLMPIDAAEVTRALRQIWLDALSHPERAWSTYAEFSQQYARLITDTTLRLWGLQPPSEPVVAPEKADKRFSAPDWQRNAVLDAIKQTYLLTATTMLKTAADIDGLDSRQQRKLVFYLRQFLDAISPTNFVFTNPQVVHAAIESGGENLARGFQNMLRDLQAGQLKMTDTDAFAPGRNLALTPGQVVYRNKLARGRLVVDGRRVSLSAIRCPLLNVAATADAIAPRTTTGAILQLVSSQDTQELLLSGGHVGTIVGRAARTQLWPRLADWLAQRD